MPIWKINFCSSVLRLSELPKCKERRQTATSFFECLGRLKTLAPKSFTLDTLASLEEGGGCVPFFSLSLPAFLISAILFFDKIRGGGGPPGLFPQIRHCGHRKNESAFQVVLRNSWRYTFLVLWVLPLATRLLKTCRYIEVSGD